jgi:formate hydrogenlyase transcriptional activator
MVADGKFRSDLFYRLHVFPIPIPALRERTGDIPALVRHFVGLFARRFGKTIDIIPVETMEALVRYPWPGNVRELEHLIERAVILSPGRELRVPVVDLVPVSVPGHEFAPTPTRLTLRESERDLIHRTLEECGWVVGGPGGAAARLGMKRTTLLSRIKKLGLSRPAEKGVE